jgi:endogenous inhibitor of DNA gyrase (YacG/DUF329 family)
MATVTLDQARNVVAQAARERNLKIVEAVPKMLADLSKEKAVYVFNVGPDKWERRLGSLGNYCVPACPEGKEVSAPLKIDGVILERVPDGGSMNKMMNRYEEGMDVARDLMFIGRGYSPELNRERWGLFISEKPVPEKAQIQKAKAELRKTYAKLVDEADNLERANKRADIGEPHRQAALALGVTKPWLATEPREATNCPACQKMVDIEAVSCPNCSAILDWEKAKEFFPEKYLAYKNAQAAK